jgi:NmrA-like family
VARGLLERGHKVRAVTRDPNSSQAKLLANAGATLVAASLADTAAVMKALEGATSLFAMTTPFGGTALETRQGVVAADAAKTAGVHLVFTFCRQRRPTDGHSALRQQVRGRKGSRIHLDDRSVGRPVIQDQSSDHHFKRLHLTRASVRRASDFVLTGKPEVMDMAQQT